MASDSEYEGLVKAGLSGWRSPGVCGEVSIVNAVSTGDEGFKYPSGIRAGGRAGAVAGRAR